LPFIGAAHVVPGRNVVGAQVFCGEFEEGFKFDLFVAQNIRVRRAAGFVLFQEQFKHVVPVFCGKVNGVQFNAELIADGLRIGRSAAAVQYSSPSSSSQFFMNRPSTLYPAAATGRRKRRNRHRRTCRRSLFSGFLTWNTHDIELQGGVF
jgi:hypothetical protein